ncbi:MAG TPA: iron-sulfur cluster assembly protein [Candidatus Binataceae bacterium]|nr:iron-sulfur cluster assembly protein [Candidatus Binataceae bacterium]
MDTDNARAQVWEAIRSVSDPELDESIADLGFIQSVAITQSESTDPSAVTEAAVHITFRLPTYWCAANFAFMMAEDLRERVVSFPWVREVKVELVDHFTSDEINRGIAAGASFSDSFPTPAEPQAAASTSVERSGTSRRIRELRSDRGIRELRPDGDSADFGDQSDTNLASLRRLFRLKAFQRRQYRLLRNLLDASHDRADLLRMTITNLRDLPITDEEGAKLRTAYLDILSEFSRNFSSDSPAFILPNGSPLDPDHLDEHLRQLRRTTINIEFNAALCTSLLKSRNTPT